MCDNTLADYSTNFSDVELPLLSDSFGDGDECCNGQVRTRARYGQGLRARAWVGQELGQRQTAGARKQDPLWSPISAKT